MHSRQPVMAFSVLQTVVLGGPRRQLLRLGGSHLSDTSIPQMSREFCGAKSGGKSFLKSDFSPTEVLPKPTIAVVGFSVGPPFQIHVQLTIEMVGSADVCADDRRIRRYSCRFWMDPTRQFCLRNVELLEYSSFDFFTRLPPKTAAFQGSLQKSS